MSAAAAAMCCIIVLLVSESCSYNTEPDQSDTRHVLKVEGAKGRWYAS